MRAQLSGWYGALHFLMGDPKADTDLEAKQHDHLSLIKHVGGAVCSRSVHADASALLMLRSAPAFLFSGAFNL